MRKYFLLFLVTILTFGLAAQSINVPLPKSLRSDNNRNSKSETKYENRKVHFLTGGNFGINFGLPNYIGFQFQPKFGIRPLDWLVIGVNGTYILDWRIIEKTTYNTFSVNPFVETYLFKNQLLLHASYEFVNYPIVSYSYDSSGNMTPVSRERISSHCILVGAGYHLQISAHSSINATVLFPVFQKNSRNDLQCNYYAAWFQPIVRIGYNYSF